VPDPLTRRTLLLGAAAGLTGTASSSAVSAVSAGGLIAPVSAADLAVQPPLPHPMAEPMRELPRTSFPPGFVFGTATAAYQIEGAVHADGRGKTIWDTFSHQRGRILHGDTGDVADDHYHRMKADLDLMKWLGLKGYRFSIAWSRIQPTGKGGANQKGMDFYKRLVDGLRARGIKPMATLFHWDLPQALQDHGGWESRDTAKRFADYAQLMYEALGDQVDCWMTLNEPKTVVQNGYRWNVHAPGIKSDARAFVAMHHLFLAHGLAVQAHRASNAGGRIGIALNMSPVYPSDRSAGAKKAAKWFDDFSNRLYLEPILHAHYPSGPFNWIAKHSPMPKRIHSGDMAIIGSPIDVLGVQYYTPAYRDRHNKAVVKHPHSAANWQQIYPQGLYDLLVRLHHDYPRMPLVVTENGIATKEYLGKHKRIEDKQRVKFMRDHLSAAHRAMAKGVPLQGYFAWSLMDNFEWNQGYSQRFGLVYVDYKTQRRVPKRSALWYRDVIRQGGF